MRTFVQDLRFGARMLAKHPAFTAVAVITLALGIGANTAIFGVLHAVLIRELPYRDPARIVRVEELSEKGGMGVSPPNFIDFQQQNRSFEKLAAYTGGSFVLTGGSEPLRVEAAGITAEMFDVLGVYPQRGNAFRSDAQRPGDPGGYPPGFERVALISHGLWQRVFGADAGVVGRQIVLDERQYTVSGVMPPGFEFPIQATPPDIWVPLVLPADMQNLRGAHYLDLVGRLKPGVQPAHARADLEVIAGAISRQFPKMVPGRVSVKPLKEDMVGSIRKSLLVLAAAVGLVLLIAAANVASLLLGRAVARRQEIAVRGALGATPARLVRQFLSESLLLGLAGGAAGVLVAGWLTNVIVGLSPAEVPRVHSVRLNFAALLFAAAISLLSALLFGLAPALHSRRAGLQDALRLSGGGSRAVARRWLVAAQMTLAVMVLAGAGLMVRTLAKLYAVDPGFDANNVAVAEVLLPRQKYGQAAQQRAFFAQLVDRVAALPGVEFAAGTSNLPMTGTNMMFMVGRQGRPDLSGPASFRSVTPEYFRAMRIPLLRGRGFNAADDENSAPVAVISEAMARTFFPGEDPIGHSMSHGFDGTQVQIVGIVGTVRHGGLDAEPRPELYVPFAQRPWPFLRVVARTRGDPAALGALLHRQLSELDSNLPADKVTTMAGVLAASVGERRFYMQLLAAFGALALLLAATGIYGVASHAATQRVREIGIRMALGAGRGDIRKMMLVDGVRPALAGLAAGLAGAAASTRLLAKLLFGVRPLDAPAFLGAAAILVLVALLASYIPARRAANVDPMVALRYE